VIIYLMTGQPLEWNRFVSFTFICWLMVLISQSLGFIIGAWFSVIVSNKTNVYINIVVTLIYSCVGVILCLPIGLNIFICS